VIPLSPSEIHIVQISFRQISRNAERSADLFYARLFEFDPALRSLVKDNFAEQKRGFIRLLGTVVHRLDCLDLVRDHLVELAICHPEVKESEEHHHSVGAALFWMLEQILQDAFTPANYGAWMTIFRTLSDDLRARVAELEAASC
jgi:hemoglobin-like flavoprotein